MGQSRYGLGTIQNVQHLDAIFEIVKDNYETLTVGDKEYKVMRNSLIQRKDIVEHQSYLSKPFYSYRNWKTYITEESYNHLVERYNQEQEKLKQKEEKRNRDNQEYLRLKKQYGNKWRDWSWIVKNIGEYYTKDIAVEYYWTLIGNNYFYKGRDVYITSQGLENIKDLRFNDLKSSTFLSRKFKRYGRSSEVYIGEEQREVESYGVYSIWKNNELIYIGSTMRNFEDRFNERRKNITMGNSKELYVYSLINSNDKIEFKILIDAKNLKVNTQLTRRDIESMELTLITLYKPVGNLAGNNYEFKYREEY